MKKNKEFYVIITTILLVLILFIYILKVFNLVSLSNLLKKSDYPNEFVCANVLVYGNSDTTVSANCKFFSDSGENFYTLERSFNGNNIYLEFVSFSHGNKLIYFPSRVYPDFETYSNGINLKKYVLNEEKCYLYSDENILRICKYCYSSFSRFNKNVKYTRINLSECKSQTNYEIIIKDNGEILLKSLEEY